MFATPLLRISSKPQLKIRIVRFRRKCSVSTKIKHVGGGKEGVGKLFYTRAACKISETLGKALLVKK